MTITLRYLGFPVIAVLVMGLLSGCASPQSKPGATARAEITILYDAFGTSSALRKDWGFAALIEVDGKRILFDTGDDAAIFAHNVKALHVDLTRLDFAVISHRHGDHIGGLTYLLSVNPGVKIYAPQENFGVFGASLPQTFFRKAQSLPPRMRYYDGQPPSVMKFGTAWPTAHFELIDTTTEVAPGITLIALVSDAPGTRELKELSLAIDTPQGLVLVVGCSHPGIEAIMAQAVKINSHVHLLAGGMHLVVAPDAVIEKTVAALHDTWKVEYVAPGHCTGEPAFAALSQAFGDRDLYAGLGTTLSFDQRAITVASASARRRANGDDWRGYQALWRRSVAADVSAAGTSSGVPFR
jgi:7,8-dihydropterin-6-yl-methyl-4-(beta-D-ribofuranosyl)aminobenzene 5'-phosphate synthase